MMVTDLIERLRHMSVETGSLVCLDCGHEHNCDVHGCAVLKEAADVLEDKLRRTPLTADELKDMVYAAGRPVAVWVVHFDSAEEEPDWENGEWQMFDGSHFSGWNVGDSVQNYGITFYAYRDGVKLKVRGAVTVRTFGGDEWEIQV